MYELIEWKAGWWKEGEVDRQLDDRILAFV